MAEPIQNNEVETQENSTGVSKKFLEDMSGKLRLSRMMQIASVGNAIAAGMVVGNHVLGGGVPLQMAWISGAASLGVGISSFVQNIQVDRQIRSQLKKPAQENISGSPAKIQRS